MSTQYIDSEPVAKGEIIELRYSFKKKDLPKTFDLLHLLKSSSHVRSTNALLTAYSN
jgi:hypothetical protein